MQYNETQVRRAYLGIQNLNVYESYRIVLGVAWPQLRDEIINQFENEKDMYGDEWPCHYHIYRVNRSDLNLTEKKAITNYVSDVDAFIIALKTNFNTLTLQTLIQEASIVKNQTNSYNLQQQYSSSSNIENDIKILNTAIEYSRMLQRIVETTLELINY